MQVRPMPVRTVVVRRILAQVAKGLWPPGSRLPAQDVLAQELGVGRSSVPARHCAELETLGIVVSRHGLGVFVREQNADRFADGLLSSVVLPPKALTEVVALRRALEVEATRMGDGTHLIDREDGSYTGGSSHRRAARLPVEPIPYAKVSSSSLLAPDRP